MNRVTTENDMDVTGWGKERGILNFDLWTIEINQKNNLNFDQIDLFIRLNSKPYPIKENTFEMWNSYISSDLVETLKKIHKRNEHV